MNLEQLLTIAPTVTVSGALLIFVVLFVNGKILSATMVERIITIAASEIAAKVVAATDAKLTQYEQHRADGEARIIETVMQFRRDDETYQMLKQLTDKRADPCPPDEV